jgi:hypothetical protein
MRAIEISLRDLIEVGAFAIKAILAKPEMPP